MLLLDIKGPTSAKTCGQLLALADAGPMGWRRLSGHHEDGDHDGQADGDEVDADGRGGAGGGREGRARDLVCWRVKVRIWLSW